MDRGRSLSRIRLADGEEIETVMIPEGARRTLCVSSQVGCSLDCSFCATGRMKLERNLRAEEIVDQVFCASERLAERGVVFSNAICSSPMCFPSRPGLFSGVHPARSGNITNRNSINLWRSYVPDAVTLPRHFSGQGWKSVGIGKNFHKGDRPEFDEYTPISNRTKEVRDSGSKWKGPRRWVTIFYRHLAA